MARPQRIEFPGAFYHVIVRGNQRQDIFLDDTDRIEYLERVRRYKEKCGFLLHAYVLMTNHVHLLLETSKTPLSKIMQLINFTYTQYFNRRYGKVGHLFQGRYKAFLCDRDEYLLPLARYIHLNPIRAKLAAEPHGYRWSSHNEYLGKGRGIVDTGMILGIFSEDVVQARISYNEFVNEALHAGGGETFYKAFNQQIIGDEEFIERLEKAVAKPDKPIRRPSLQELFDAVEELTGIGREEIKSRRRGGDVIFARGLLVGACREFGYSLTELQEEIRRDLSVLSRSTKVLERAEGRKAMEKLLKRLKA
jgi:REP element-mobilizing transposase RayT